VGETDFINSDGGVGGGFFWFNVAPSTSVGPTTPYAMAVFSNNTFAISNGMLRLGDRTLGSFASGGASLSANATNVILNSGAAGGVYLNYDQGTGGVHIGNGASASVAVFDTLGNLTLNAGLGTTGIVACDAALIAGEYAQPTTANARGYSTYIYTNSATPIQSNICCTGDGGSRGTLQMGGIGPGGSDTYFAFMLLTDTLATINTNLSVVGSVTSLAGGFVADGGGPSTFGPSTRLTYSGGAAYLDSFSTSTTVAGSMMIRMVTSNASTVINTLQLDTGGNCHVFGTMSAGNAATAGAGGLSTTGGCTATVGFFTSGTKAFVIPHPLDDTKELMHACLEGPENGVFYRGEAVTKNGVAEVVLPDYFEALTFDDDRSVLLTQIYADGSDELTMLAASRVIDGKFNIRSSAQTATVAWEVKAVRKVGVPVKLEVVRAKEKPQQFHTTEGEQSNEQASTDAKASRRTTNGSGAPEDGKLHTQAPSHAATGAGRASRTRHTHRAN
jgi:hypothetical protein